MEALFDMFMRADIKRHRNIEGSGLGLTIAKELCEQMGGIFRQKVSMEKEVTLQYIFH